MYSIHIYIYMYSIHIYTCTLYIYIYVLYTYMMRHNLRTLSFREKPSFFLEIFIVLYFKLFHQV